MWGSRNTYRELRDSGNRDLLVIRGQGKEGLKPLKALPGITDILRLRVLGH